MFQLEKRFTFEASHQLPNHDGKCRRLHGHSWKGVIRVAGNFLHQSGPKAGMLIDYGDLSAIVKPIIDGYLDHYHLNESIPSLVNPTSEELARWLYHMVRPAIPDDVRLVSVTIEETCTSAAIYYGS